MKQRSESASVLAKMALEHMGGGAESAASLLLAMEYNMPFEFQSLLSFDTCNLRHAHVLLANYKPHDIWPSKWLDDAGHDGKAMIQGIHDKWRSEF